MNYKRSLYLWFIPFVASVVLFAALSPIMSYGMGILVLFSFVGISNIIIEYMRDIAGEKHMAFMEKREEVYDLKKDLATAQEETKKYKKMYFSLLAKQRRKR